MIYVSYWAKIETFIIVLFILHLIRRWRYKLSSPIALGVLAFAIDRLLNVFYRLIPHVYPSMTWAFIPVLQQIFSLIAFIAIFYLLKHEKFSPYILTALVLLNNLLLPSVSVSAFGLLTLLGYTLLVFFTFSAIRSKLSDT